MPMKCYRLTDKAEPFLDENEELSFRMRVSKTDESGKKVRLGRDKCPIIKVKKNGVIKTNDEYAQKLIENYIVPQNFAVNNGQPFPSGFMFEEIDMSTQADKDLDLHFEKVKLPKKNRS